MDSPSEWTKDATGWGQRYGSSLLDNGINTTSLVWLSRAMGQDPRYRRCDCTGSWARARHAIKLEFMAYNRSGNLTFAPAKLIAPYTGPLVTRNTIYPNNFGTGDAFSGGVFILPAVLPGTWYENSSGRCIELPFLLCRLTLQYFRGTNYFVAANRRRV